MTKPVIIQDMWMEDVLHCNIRAQQTIEDELKKKHIFLTDEQSNFLSDKIWEALEELSNGEYQHHL